MTKLENYFLVNKSEDISLEKTQTPDKFNNMYFHAYSNHELQFE